MAAGLVTVNFKDAAGATLTGRFYSSDGTTAGLLYPAPVIIDAAGNVVDYSAPSAVTQSGTWTVQPGNTANTTAWKVDGSAFTQPVSIATAPVLVAGSAVVGKVGVDQTTPGTTNGIVVNDRTGADALGAVTASPTANTVLGRLKDLLSLIVLGAGANIIGKVGIDQTTPGTSNAVYVTSVGFDVATTITRPANVTAYTANDVLGGALDLGVLGPSGKTVQITGIQLEADIAAIPTGQTSWILHLYNVTPPSALADNAAWDLPSGDRASYLGQVPIQALVDQGSTLYVEASNINKQVALSGTHLFGYLVTVGGFTPAANSEVYKPTVHTLAV